jgi:hypothetical protein
MRVIHKYPIPLETVKFAMDEFPEGEVVKVAFQAGWPYVWINHEKDTIHKMNLCWFMTGEEFDDMSLNHVGSCVSDTFVLHVYRNHY